MNAPARVARAVLLAMAASIIASYVVMALRVADGRAIWLGCAVGAALLLALPLPLLLRGRGRSGFWYALISTIFVAHGVELAVLTTSRATGLVLLGSALVLFLAGAFLLRLGGTLPR